jgi:hypothetical protein
VPVKYWCNSHRQPAIESTYADGRQRLCCAPGQGGILIPCMIIVCEEVGIEILTKDEAAQIQ